MIEPLYRRFGVCFDFSSTGDVVTEYPTHKLSSDIWYYDYTHSPHGNINTSDSATGQPNYYPRQYQQVWNCKSHMAGNGTATLGSVAARFPGKKWLIGNEPDVAGQSNNTPAQYAEGYYYVYQALKDSDPTCVVYAGGIGQMSPMRFRWLDDMLSAYESNYGSALPCDGIHAHGYIIEESPYSGIGYAVGVTGTADARGGTAWQHHTDSEQFYADLIAMRVWMSSNGMVGKPLIISEYGSLLPAEGWGSTPEVQGAYMQDTFDYMLHTKDPYVGCTADHMKLAQEFAWFSLNYDPIPDGMLMDRTTRNLKLLGRYYRDIYYTQFMDNWLSTEAGGDLYNEDVSLLYFGQQSYNAEVI